MAATKEFIKLTESQIHHDIRKAALSAAADLLREGLLHEELIGEPPVHIVATLIDTAYAPYHQRVAALVEFIEKVITAPDTATSPVTKIYARAALAAYRGETDEPVS